MVVICDFQSQGRGSIPRGGVCRWVRRKNDTKFAPLAQSVEHKTFISTIGAKQSWGHGFEPRRGYLIILG